MKNKNGENLLSTNFSSLNKLNTLLKSEVFKCLNSYLEFVPEKIMCDLCVDGNGEYVFRCKVNAKRLKMMSFLPGDELWIQK